jgi:hypothetical protein
MPVSAKTLHPPIKSILKARHPVKKIIPDNLFCRTPLSCLGEIFKMKNPIEITGLVVKNPTTNLPQLVIEKLDAATAGQITTITREFYDAVHEFGQSGLRVGEILKRAQSLMEPKGIFTAWINTIPAFSITTAYRLIAKYEASQTMPRPVIEIATAAGINIVGTSKSKPFGKYTTVVEKIGTPPKNPSTEQAGNWLQTVIHTYNRGRRDARSQTVNREQAVSFGVRWLVRLGRKLPAEEHADFIYETFERTIKELEVRKSVAAILRHRKAA